MANMSYDSWSKECPRCQADLQQMIGSKYYTRLISVVDRDKDCVVAYRCPDCEAQWPRSLGEIIVNQEIS